MDYLVQKESQGASQFFLGGMAWFLKKMPIFGLAVHNNSLAYCAPNFDE